VAGGRLFGLLAGALACGLLVVHTAQWRGERGLGQLRTPRRYWEDVSVASCVFYRGGRPPTEEAVVVGSGSGPELRRAYERFVSQAADEAGIRPWQFWRMVPIKPYLALQNLVHRPSDDVGRAELLTWGFRVLGGVAPWLGVWLAVLLCLPVLIWTAWELCLAGRPVAAAVFLLLLACSPFVVEVLSLPYSAIGFYLVALLALVPTGAAALLGPVPSPRSVWVRATAAGAVLAIAAVCRSGSILLLPAFVALLGIAAARSVPRPRMALGVWAVALAFLAGPYLIVRQPRHHYAWPGIWEGLGDFDRTKGHTWYDPAARDALRAAGVQVTGDMRGPEFETPETSRVFRSLVLAHVREDPLWYAGILLRRLAATVSQSKLWPRAATDGATMAASTSENEGVIDVYYHLATTVDVLGLGRGRLELPVPLLIAPTVVLVGLAALRRFRARVGPALALIAIMAAAALVQPVLITTASALETEAFALAYFLGLAFLLDVAARRQ
jgi:hypothetical protein